MKKFTLKAICCFISIIMCTTILGCGKSKDTATNTKKEVKENVEETKVVKSKDNLCQITVPKSYTTENLQNPQATIQLADKLKEKCVLAISESKKDFASSFTLDKYFNLLTTEMKKSVKNSKVTNAKDIKINGNKSKQYEFSGEIGEIKIKYNIALIEGKKGFYQITTWTSQSKFDKSKAELDKIINSFKEL
ncbi:PsbP-related protein [Clostridium rectalis]|uniref:PsbP-related protein n=1 Tax=Clostridium rectalis TaxID=2040295 RepID=UPI000F63E4EC|nr:hypothetical protein [Clostridium rectalis]